MSSGNSTPDPDQRRTVVRFAPSPNGRLHLGHARSALINWHFAKVHRGDFLLRVEDIDTTRARPEFETAIREDLAWLGLTWSEPVRRQSEEVADYNAALEELDRLGLIYPAFLSRKQSAEIVRDAEASGRNWPRDPDGAPHYSGNDRSLPRSERRRRIEAGAPHTWRLDLQSAIAGVPEGLVWSELGLGPQGETGQIAADPAAWGDVVLARRDTPASYHLAVTVDDAFQEVTDVIRGQDLFAATSVHRLLQTLLGLPAPVYRHHSLIRDRNGRKLSKSDGDTALAALRADGATAEEVIALACPEFGHAPGDA